MPNPPRPLEAKSPSTDDSVALDGKKPKKPGCWTWVMPGTTTRSNSSSIVCMLTGSDGGEGGSNARMDPGPMVVITGRSSSVERKLAIQSTS